MGIDGAGCSARLLKKYGAKVVGGLHIHMPDFICDVKLLKKSLEMNQKIIREADRKIERWAGKIKRGRYPQDGLHFYDRIAGLLCQRLWFLYYVLSLYQFMPDAGNYTVGRQGD